jgi:UDP-N-acetylmuramate: L-alanyl-gamma-D-glutamyl-meso-diaminopimelate ligase
VLGADSADAMALKSLARSRVETFGLSESADWHAYDVTPIDGGTSFRVQQHGVGLGTFVVRLVGEYNVRNALAAMAVAADVGVSAETMREGLATFAGVRRRLEMVGAARGVTVFDDFAHHPTAVRETLDAMRAAHRSSRIWAVFEPRSASSCRRVFQKDFAQSFGSADQTVIAGVYRSSLSPDERLSTDALIADLRSAGQHARHIPTVDAIVATISDESRAGDLVVIMSNGGFGGIHAKLLKALTKA